MTAKYKQMTFDNSGIFVEKFKRDGLTVSSEEAFSGNSDHALDCYELTLILKGRGDYTRGAVTAPLISGSLILCPPNESRTYHYYQDWSVCRCFFRPYVLRKSPESTLCDIRFFEGDTAATFKRQLDDIRLSRQDTPRDPAAMEQKDNVDDQPLGVFHLSPSQTESIHSICDRMLKEQESRHYGYEDMKVYLLEELFMTLKRIQIQQYDLFYSPSTWKQDLVDSVNDLIDKDITNVDFDALALKSKITSSYFRMIFKNMTGVSPHAYLNNARILRSLELLQTTSLPISAIASSVGIYDP